MTDEDAKKAALRRQIERMQTHDTIRQVVAAREGQHCRGPHEEPAEVTVGDLCQAHYMQQRRGGPLKPLRTRPGEAGRVVFRMDLATQAEVSADAKRERIDESEWYRRAVAERLERRRKRG